MQKHSVGEDGGDASLALELWSSPGTVTVPEGYTGNEAPVCFVLPNRSGQICVPEAVLSGVLGRESCSCW